MWQSKQFFLVFLLLKKVREKGGGGCLFDILAKEVGAYTGKVLIRILVLIQGTTIIILKF